MSGDLGHEQSRCERYQRKEHTVTAREFNTLPRLESLLFMTGRESRRKWRWIFFGKETVRVRPFIDNHQGLRRMLGVNGQWESDASSG